MTRVVSLKDLRLTSSALGYSLTPTMSMMIFMELFFREWNSLSTYMKTSTEVRKRTSMAEWPIKKSSRCVRANNDVHGTTLKNKMDRR